MQKGVDPSRLLVFPMPVAAGGELPRLTLKPWASGYIGISRNSGNSELATGFLEFYPMAGGGGAVRERSTTHLP